jgi:integrase
MALRMAKLERDPRTGSWKSRKVIPADVRHAFGKANDTPTWPASLTAAQAKAEWRTWLSDLEARIERVRRLSRAEPSTLTHREIIALAGKWYAAMVAQHEDDPGGEAGWAAAIDQIEPADPDEAYEAHLAGEHYDGPVKRIPWVEEQAYALLEAEGLVLDPTSRDALIERLHEHYVDLCHLMLRRCRGDYGADPVLQKLPTWEPPHDVTRTAPSSTGIMELFDGYVAERKPAASSQKAYKGRLQHLVAFLGHDRAADVTADDMQRWKERLLTEEVEPGKPRSAKTVKDGYLAAAKTVFSWAVENRLLPLNPAEKVKVRVPRRRVVRDRGLTIDEAALILTGSLRSIPAGLSPRRALAFRWVPWLCAYTGARVNEMTQLRKEDVRQVDGVWTVHITPDAGSTKTHQPREVPIHPHLIEQGFVAMVEAAKAGPIFYDPEDHRGGSEANPQSNKVGEAIARWVRGLGVTDPRVAPSHGWRHRFETEMRSAGVDFEARQLILGHAAPTQGGDYGRWAMPALKREIEKVPRYSVA